MSEVLIKTESEMIEYGKQLGTQSKPGDSIGLIGDLGAGKTHFTKGFALGIQCESQVTSPTFSLLHEYREGSSCLYHFDLYRLESEMELIEIGWEDYLEIDGICIVEWADKFPEIMPEKMKWLEFQVLDDGIRSIKEVSNP
ncbi:MAG: tRNA (adenosine(37)-N6)-threonylcarbamoyltransferase complex ATPase subunit type 1 TsaE [Verrucomicrobia bacterium]|nr:MAG: tRNA (adenosine(37)-N6)-threonylcarbamoyltransferase complex ATPase subunit type 1 TsaE [Verrucomicrobiota bacterium]|tara:strand:- start:77 stop:499 length:423 start_codon:yes stop_codon:yes gene_type:complete